MSLYTQLALIAVLSGIGGSMRPSRPRVVSADRIVLEKSTRRLVLMRKDVAVRSYRVALGPRVFDPERYERGTRAPEGLYVITSRDDDSHLHRTLRLTEIDRLDAAKTRKRRLFPREEIAIHGTRVGWGWLGPFQIRLNQTRGCIAVTDAEIEEICVAAPVGTLVEIKP